MATRRLLGEGEGSDAGAGADAGAGVVDAPSLSSSSSSRKTMSTIVEDDVNAYVSCKYRRSVGRSGIF